MPSAYRPDGYVLWVGVHTNLPPLVEWVNARFRAALGLRGRSAEGEAALILRSSGPLWYRGLLPAGGKPASTEEEITRALEHFGVKAMVVGHTTLDHVMVFHDGRVFGIDGGIQEGRPGEAWFWEGGQAWRGSSEGGLTRLWPLGTTAGASSN